MEVKNYIPIFVTYQCSQCRKIVTTKHILQETITVSSQDTIVWQGASTASSNEKKEIQPGKKLNRVLEEQKRGLYRIAEFDCKCPNCSHREPWSQMRYRFLDIIMGSILPIGILFTIILFSFGIKILGVVLAYLLLKRVHRAIIEKNIRLLPQQSLPYFALTPEESVALFYQANNKASSAAHNSVADSENSKAYAFAQSEYDEIIKHWAQIYAVSRNEDIEQSIKKQVIAGLWQKYEYTRGSAFVRKLKVFISYIDEDKLAEELNIINRFYNGEFKT